MCPYELALKLHELGVNSESEFYFVKEVKGGGSKTESIAQNTMRYSYRKEGDLIPAYMSHELGEILPSMINISKSKIWDDWLPCPRCGLRPLVWEFDNGRVTAWGCCLLSSGGQSRASNTVTSNSLHASFI